MDMYSIPCGVTGNLKGWLSSVTECAVKTSNSRPVAGLLGTPARGATQCASPPSSSQTGPPFWADGQSSRQHSHRNSILQSGNCQNQHPQTPRGQLSNLPPLAPTLLSIHHLLEWNLSYRQLHRLLPHPRFASRSLPGSGGQLQRFPGPSHLQPRPSPPPNLSQPQEQLAAMTQRQRHPLHLHLNHPQLAHTRENRPKH
jgi:hypothetical protein